METEGPKVTDIAYNSEEGWKKVIESLSKDHLVFLFNIKDFWTKNLVNQCQIIGKSEEELVKNIITMIGFYEWHIHLYKIYHYLKKGVTEGIFDPDIKLKQCNIPYKIPDLPIDYFTKIRFKCIKNNEYIELLDKSNSEHKTLVFYCVLNFEEFTFLDVAIALHASMLLPPTYFISEALNLGANIFHKFEYEVPFAWADAIEPGFEFSLNKFSHLEALKSCKSCLSRPIVSSNRDDDEKGIFNILTGEYVRPQNGTYYIDDFTQ